MKQVSMRAEWWGRILEEAGEARLKDTQRGAGIQQLKEYFLLRPNQEGSQHTWIDIQVHKREREVYLREGGGTVGRWRSYLQILTTASSTENEEVK